MNDSPLNSALRYFEATEANLLKLEKIWEIIQELIPKGISFGDDPLYEDERRNFYALLEALPKIQGWKPNVELMDLNMIAQSRFDAQEIGELECITSVEESVSEPGRLLQAYRYKFNQERKKLIRESIIEIINTIDINLFQLNEYLNKDLEYGQLIEDPKFDSIKDMIDQIDTLLGSSVARPSRWNYLRRHLAFSMLCDLSDIITLDWPTIKTDLNKFLYDEKEP